MVLHLDLDAQLLEREDHLRAEVLEAVHRRDGEVPLLVAGLVPEVRATVELELAARVPHALDRVDVVVARVLVLIEAGRVEDVELGFGPDVDGVGDAGALDVLLRLLRDVARVAGVRLARHRVLDVTVDGERRVLAERVDDRRVRVGHEEHVRLLDLLEPADRRAVEPVAVVEAVRRQLVDRHREVLHEAGEVAEPEVHDLGARVLGQLQHVARGALLRHFYSFVVAGRIPSSGVPAPANRREPMPPSARPAKARVGHRRAHAPSLRFRIRCPPMNALLTDPDLRFRAAVAVGRPATLVGWNGHSTTCCAPSKNAGCASCASGSPTCSASSRASRSLRPSSKAPSKRA